MASTTPTNPERFQPAVVPPPPPEVDGAIHLLELLYRSVSAPDTWPTFFRSLAERVGGRATLLILRGYGTGPTPSYVDLESVTPYPECFSKLNPARVFGRRAFSETCFGIGLLSGSASGEIGIQIRESWQDFQSALGNGNEDASPEADPTCAIEVFLMNQTKTFVNEDRHLFRILLPALHRALGLRARLEELEGQRQALSASLNHIRTGVAIVDDEARILHANATGLRLIGGRQGLRSKDGRLRATEHAAAETLERLIRSAAHRGLAPSRRRRRPSEVVSCLSVGDSLTLHVLPLPTSDRRFPESASAIVLLASSQTEPLVSAATLQALFGLTPAEARLCSSLSSGASLAIVAEELDISVHTARVHLKKILAKTGTRRQAELMRLLCVTSPSAAALS